MSSGQPSATIATTSETPAASTAGTHVAPGADPPPVLSPAELSAAVRDLALAMANMRTFLQVTHGLPTVVSAPPPPSPPPLAPHASPPPAPAANQGVPITNIKWPASPSQRPSWVDAPVFTPAPAQPTVPPLAAYAAPSHIGGFSGYGDPHAGGSAVYSPTTALATDARR
nr:leucine-rich repeat extensin-like protein 3 [Lolium perenne]